LDATLDTEGVIPKYRDMLVRLAADPVGQTLVFHLIMRLFFQHVLGIRPESIEGRRGAKRAAPREWCTDGLAASGCAPGIFGPIAAFRGEIEAQGRGSLHPHILVWLVLLSVFDVVQILAREPEHFQRNVFDWMKASVSAAESICQSSVRSLPRRFGDVHGEATPLGFSATEQRLSGYDGGSEYELLEAVPEAKRTEKQCESLAALDKDLYCRPCLPLRNPSGQLLSPVATVGAPRTSVYDKSISHFAVGACPKYRRHGTLQRNVSGTTTSGGATDRVDTAETATNGLTGGAEEAGPATDETERWQSSFAADVRQLAQEIFVHICGDSCHKYSGKKVEQICRHGFYHIIHLSESGQRTSKTDGLTFRRRGKALRNAVFVVQSSNHCMQGRLLMLQEHPFEVQTNYAGSAALRCNFDVQDLRRVLSEHLGRTMSMPGACCSEEREKEFGYMATFEWDADAYVERGPVETEHWQDDHSHHDWRVLFLKHLNHERADASCAKSQFGFVQVENMFEQCLI